MHTLGTYLQVNTVRSVVDCSNTLLCLMQVDLQRLIPEHSFTTVSGIYSEQNMLPLDSMRKLLLQLGAADHIAVPQKTCTLQPSHKAASPWADLDLGDAPQAGWIINDYFSGEFEAIVQSVGCAADVQAMRHALHWVTCNILCRFGLSSLGMSMNSSVRTCSPMASSCKLHVCNPD